MAMTVKVNGTDRTSLIDWRSFSVEQIISSQSDSCKFRYKKYGSRTFEPAINDTIEVIDGSTTIFGGIVIKIEEHQPEVKITEYRITATSYERLLDRYLATVSYEKDNSMNFLINSLINEFVNNDALILMSAESTETFTDEAGTTSANTTTYIYGAQSRQMALSASGTITSRIEPALDATAFSNNVTSDTSDQISLWVHISKADNLASVRLRLGNETGGTYTNYVEESWTTGFVNGWNQLVVVKSAMTETGTMVWSDIDSVQISATANANGAVTVLFDDIRMIQDDAVTQQNVRSAGVTMGSVRFNYEQISECIRQLAKVILYEWYIDENRDLHFFPQSFESAPFELTDNGGDYIFKSLKIRRDLSNIRNQIYVRGGSELGSSYTEDLSHQADGVNDIFKVGYKYANVVVEIDDVSKNVGIDNIHNEDLGTTYDVLYNFQEKFLRFDTAPLGTEKVEIIGDPYIPIVIKKRDQESIDQYGVFEYRIVDKTIETREAARQRAAEELTAYRDKINEGEFRSFSSGLRAGQEIRVDSTIRDLDETFIINRLSIRMHSPSDAIYTAGLVSTRTFGIIDFLISLLRNDAKDIEIGDDEVLDLVETFTETITATEVITTTDTSDESAQETITATEDDAYAIDNPPTWVTGKYAPTDIFPTDDNRPAFTDRDNYLAS